MKRLISKWYLVIVAGFILFAGLVFSLSGEDSIIAAHDNLDLFIPQFKMMKDRSEERRVGKECRL